MSDRVDMKPAARNHKGFFVQDTDYELVGVERSAWERICMDEAVCHYIDPDNLLIYGGSRLDLAQVLVRATMQLNTWPQQDFFLESDVILINRCLRVASDQ